MEIKTWADFGALSKEELDAYQPEELEALKTSIKENEDKLVLDRDEEKNKLKEYGENQKIRAEKAEKGEKKEEKDGYVMSEKDIFALSKANIEEEDLDEIKDYAQFKKLTVADALKDKTLQGILSDNAEKRQSARAVDIGKGGRSTTITGETLLTRAEQGQVPEDDEGIDKLVNARMAQKFKKRE